MSQIVTSKVWGYFFLGLGGIRKPMALVIGGFLSR